MGWKQMSQFALKLHLNQVSGPKKLIGLDIGSLSTGVSISCESLKKIYLLKVLQYKTNTPKFIQKLKQTIRSEENIKGIIIGKPSHTQEINKIQQTIKELTLKLQGKNHQNLSYCFVDQNWTTVEARMKIQEIKSAIQYHGHLHGQKELEDGIAAMKILERYLDYYNRK